MRTFQQMAIEPDPRVLCEAWEQGKRVEVPEDWSKRGDPDDPWFESKMLMRLALHRDGRAYSDPGFSDIPQHHGMARTAYRLLQFHDEPRPDGDRPITRGEAYCLHGPTIRLLRMIEDLRHSDAGSPGQPILTALATDYNEIARAILLRQRLDVEAMKSFMPWPTEFAVIAERCGMWGEFLGDLIDDDPKHGKLHWPKKILSQTLKLLVVTCPSTGRTHVLTVPARDDLRMEIRTAKAARLWTFAGVDPKVET